MQNPPTWLLEHIADRLAEHPVSVWGTHLPSNTHHPADRAAIATELCRLLPEPTNRAAEQSGWLLLQQITDTPPIIGWANHET